LKFFNLPFLIIIFAVNPVGAEMASPSQQEPFTCRAWLQEDGENLYLRGWVLGQLAELSVGKGQEMRAMSGKDEIDWISDYCEAHPADTLATAARQLLGKMTRIKDNEDNE
jgi:hypothetical protein